MFDLNEMQVTKRKAIEEMAYFPLYESFDYGLYATEDGTPSKIHSEQTKNMVLWMYDGSFDPTQWEENLVAVSSGHENHDDSDDNEPCNCSSLDLSEFSEGSYVFVITSEHTHSNGSHETKIYSEDGTVMEEWTGTLCENGNLQGYDCGDNPSDDDNRAYAFFDYHRYYQNDDHDEGPDDNFGRSILANITAWKDGSPALLAADNIVSIFYEADAAGLFSGDDDDHDHDMIFYCSNDGDEYASQMGGIVCPEGPNVQPMCPNNEPCHCIDIDDSCEDGDDDWGYPEEDYPEEDECPFTNRNFCRDLEYMCNDEEDGGDPVRCGRDIAHYCLENDDPGCAEVVTACTVPINAENASICAAYNSFDHDLYHDNRNDSSDVYLDGVEGEETRHNWDNEGLTVNPENVVGNVMTNNNLSITQSASFVLAFDPVDATLSQHVLEFRDGGGDDVNYVDYHCWSEPGMNGSEMRISFDKVNDGTEDCGDGADEPQDMDGDGTNDSWFNCNDPLGTNVNMEKTNDGTEDCPNGADEGVDPYDDGDAEIINATLRVLPGYEIVSCNNCTNSSISADKTTVTFTIGNDDEFSIVFMKSLETCDHTIGLGPDGYSFDIMSLQIKLGETVCWQWTNAADAHNVVQVASTAEGTDWKNATISNGFYSGEASNPTDFRVTFSASDFNDDTTYFYMCELHADMGMVGEIVVGNGTPQIEDAIQALEESGIPNIGFLVGVLVLVGAAGLRRRVD